MPVDEHTQQPLLERTRRHQSTRDVQCGLDHSDESAGQGCWRCVVCMDWIRPHNWNGPCCGRKTE